MTSYTLFPSRPALAAGSSSPTPFIAGISFRAGGWLEGYWWYVPPGGPTAAQKFALWCITGGPGAGTPTAGSVVAGSVVLPADSGPLTAGAWNFIPLAAPIPLAIATPYMAATGFSITSVFTDVPNQFGSGDPFASGITNGPLFGFSDATGGGTAGTGNPWQLPQGSFSIAGSDPAVIMPAGSSNSGNFGIDVQVSDTVPAGYRGPFSFYPNTAAASVAVAGDAAVNYGVAVEGLASSAVSCATVRYFSPKTATQLATWCGVWDVATQTLISSNPAPSWSGAAGSGWVQASLPVPARIGAGKRFKLHVHNGASVPGVCFAKDTTDRWGTGLLAGGIAAGPVTAPGLSGASDAWNYNNNPAGTPPYSDGTHLAHGQSTFSQTAPGTATPPYPLLWASGGTADGTQDYFVDGVFSLASGSGLLMASGLV